jgi:hypothetical protein
MNVTAQVDLREFTAAMQRLSVISKRTFADVANDNMADLFLTASRYAPKADKGAVRNVSSERWWPAFIQKVIGTGFNLRFRRSAKTAKQRNVTWIDTPTGAQKFGRRTFTIQRKANRNRADARRVSSKIIARRVNTVGGMRAVLGWVATKFNPGKVRSFYRKNLKHSYIYPATPSKAIASAVVSFSNNKSPWPNSPKAPRGRPSPAQDVTQKESFAMAALNKAIPVVTARLVHAANKKLERIARETSGTTRAIRGAF